MPLGNSLLVVRTHRTFTAQSRWIQDDGRDLFMIIHPSAGRVSSVVRAAVACCWCLVVLFLLATGLVSRRGRAAAPHVASWRVARRSARPVWLGGSRRYIESLHFSFLIFFNFFTKAKAGLEIRLPS